MLSSPRRLPHSALAQVFQSGSAFVATILYSRHLDPTNFGILSIYWIVLILFMSFNRAVFGEQLIAGTKLASEKRQYVQFMTLWTATLTISSLTIAIGSEQYAIVPGVVFVSLFISADSVRYWVLATSRKHSDTKLFIFDAIRFSVCALALFCYGYFDQKLLSISALTMTPLITYMAFPGAISVSITGTKHYVKTRGRFETIMGLQFLTLSASTQLVPLAVVPAFGAAALGALNLTRSLLAPIATLASSFQPTLIRLIVQSSDDHKAKLLFQLVLVKSVLVTMSTVTVYYGLRSFGHLIVGSDQMARLDPLILPCLVGISASVLGQAGGALIRVMRLGRVSLQGQAGGVAITLVGVMAAVHHGTISDVAWALSAGTITTVILSYLLVFFRLTRK